MTNSVPVNVDSEDDLSGCDVCILPSAPIAPVSVAEKPVIDLVDDYEDDFLFLESFPGFPDEGTAIATPQKPKESVEDAELSPLKGFYSLKSAPENDPDVIAFKSQFAEMNSATEAEESTTTFKKRTLSPQKKTFPQRKSYFKRSPVVKDGAKETLKMKVVDVAEGSDETSAVQNVNLPNRNVEWLQAKGSWIIHIGVIVFGKVLFSIIPGITPETSWTLTNLFYNMASFIIFHWLIGTPFADCSQTGHEVYSLTLWEQIDLGEQFTPTRKFLTAIPVVLFLLSTHYSNFDAVSFSVNFFSVLINLLAKMPVMDRVRLFGINKGK